MSPGLGVVLVPQLERVLRERPGLVDFVEVEPQTLWRHVPGEDSTYRAQDDAFERLERLPQAKLVHGVGFPVGGSLDGGGRHHELLGRFLDALDVPWWSEHLAFNRARAPSGTYQAGFLLPPLQSPETVELAAAAIRSARARHAGRPFAFETGVNYLRPRAGELRDGDFAAAVSEAADCDILLDLHNLWANERNGRQPLLEFVASLPLERVREVHLAGGMELDGYWLDAHSGPTPEELCALAAEVLPRLPRLEAVVFEILPEAAERSGEGPLLEALETVRALVGDATSAQSTGATRRAPPARAATHAELPTTVEWEDALASLAVGREPQDELGRELLRDPGVHVLRRLVREGRAGRIAEGLTLSCLLLRTALGKLELRGLLDRFFALGPPLLFAADEAEQFAAFLEAEGIDAPGLPDALAFERALLEASVHGTAVTVELSRHPADLAACIRRGELPPRGKDRVRVELAP